jgi:hypothetical protein
VTAPSEQAGDDLLPGKRLSHYAQEQLHAISEITALFAHPHPAHNRKPDDHGDRYRPYADADVAYGLPHAFIARDLAIALLGIFSRIIHRQPSPSGNVNPAT